MGPMQHFQGILSPPHPRPSPDEHLKTLFVLPRLCITRMHVKTGFPRVISSVFLPQKKFQGRAPAMA